jgi:hypothetical protein
MARIENRNFLFNVKLSSTPCFGLPALLAASLVASQGQRRDCNAVLS